MSSPPTTTPTLQWPTTTSSSSYAFTGKIMLASVTTLFVLVLLLLLLHLYSRWRLLRLQHLRASRRRTRRNRNVVVYVDGNGNGNGGLDGSVLKSLPVFVYSSENDGGLPECAVCLSEFEDGERCRRLTKCRHCFHTECIDLWFCSNSTCPLCRSPVVVAGEPEVAILVDPPESLPEMTVSVETVLFGDGTKRVDVGIGESNRNELSGEIELQPSPASRLLSLKRMISMSRKSPTPAVSPAGVGASCVGVAAELDVGSTSQEPTRKGNG